MPVKELDPHVEFASWRVPEFQRPIEYPLEVMEEIRAFACDELLQLSNGGDEVGGVLFGTRREDLLRILTWRPIACEHSQGEGLRLSHKDRLNLAVQLEVGRKNPDLKDLRPIGCFVSHLSEGVSLSASDLEIYNGFFPEAWQVALVICPQGGGRAQAGFFVREADGKVQSEASYQGFELTPLNRHAAATKVATTAPPEAARPEPPPVVKPKVAVAPPPEAPPPQPLPVEKPRVASAPPPEAAPPLPPPVAKPKVAAAPPPEAALPEPSPVIRPKVAAAPPPEAVPPEPSPVIRPKVAAAPPPEAVSPEPSPVVKVKVASAPPPEAALPQPSPAVRAKEIEAPAEARWPPPQNLPGHSFQAPAFQSPALRSPHVQSPQVQPQHVQSPQVQPQHVQSQHVQPPPFQSPAFQAPAFQSPHVQSPPFQSPPFQPPPFQTPALQAPTFQIDEALPSRERWFWAIPVLLALGIAGFMLYQRQLPSLNGSIALRASSEAQTVQLAWDPNSKAIRDAFRGELEIKDGDNDSRVSLTTDQLHAGKMSYLRQSGDVAFGLTVYPTNGEPIHDSTRLIAPVSNAPIQPPQLLPANPVAASPVAASPAPATPPPANATPANPPPPAADQSALQQQVQRLKEDLGKERARADELQNLVRILENRLGIKSEPPKSAPRR